MIPISDRTRRAIIPARHARILVIGFGIRHLLGVVGFIVLTIMFYNLGGNGWIGMAGGATIYTVVAAMNFRKLYRQYRRRLAAEAATATQGK